MSESHTATAPKVFLESMGCQMNLLDSELVLGKLRAAGYERVAAPDLADVVLYYTCSVREHAEDKVYGRLGALKRVKQERPEMIVGVMGCMAQNHKELIFKRAPHVDLVCGTSRFEDVTDLLEEVRHGQRVLAIDRKDLDFDRDIGVRPRSYSAFITAMRGCNKFCTFCIVPYTQGRERSRPLADLLDEARRLVDDGVIEVTVLGQRIDTYGLDLKDGTTLASLLRGLHDEVPGLERIAFITSHPNHMTRELAKTIAERPRVSRYLHLPVQSGSDRVLAAMNRGYTVDDYRRAVAMMREEIDDLAVATDWIVGFPGETDEDFAESVALLREMDYQGSFIFRYSPRSGTRADAEGDPISLEIKAARNTALLEAQNDISLARNERRVGETVNVLVEGPSKKNPEMLSGRSDRNQIVCFPAGPRDLVGRIAPVKIVRCTALTLFGELV